MNRLLSHLLIVGTALCLLPACESKKTEKKFEFKVPEIKVPDIKIPDIKFPTFKSPVAYTEEPEGKFQEDGNASIRSIPNCKDEKDEEVFDTRLEKGQKFVDTFVLAADSAVLFGRISTKTVDSVSHNVIEVKASDDVGLDKPSDEEKETCTFKKGAVVCVKAASQQKTETESKPNADAEQCDYSDHKSESNVSTKGIFTLKNGVKVPAVKQVQIQSVDYKCGKGQEPKVSKGKGQIKKIKIYSYNVLEINRPQCKGTIVYSLEETKNPDGNTLGIRKEILAAPVIQ